MAVYFLHYNFEFFLWESWLMDSCQAVLFWKQKFDNLFRRSMLARAIGFLDFLGLADECHAVSIGLGRCLPTTGNKCVKIFAALPLPPPAFIDLIGMFRVADQRGLQKVPSPALHQRWASPGIRTTRGEWDTTDQSRAQGPEHIPQWWRRTRQAAMAGHGPCYFAILFLFPRGLFSRYITWSVWLRTSPIHDFLLLKNRDRLKVGRKRWCGYVTSSYFSTWKTKQSWSPNRQMIEPRWVRVKYSDDFY